MSHIDWAFTGKGREKMNVDVKKTGLKIENISDGNDKNPKLVYTDLTTGEQY